MSDWTYEMLRYAFAWNGESAQKAVTYVVHSVFQSRDGQTKLQQLDAVEGGQDGRQFFSQGASSKGGKEKLGKTGKAPASESDDIVHLLDHLLLTALTGKDDVSRGSALIFLEEHAEKIVPSRGRLQKILSVLDTILSGDQTAQMSLVKGQALVTYTTLVIMFDLYHEAPTSFTHFVARLQAVVLQQPVPASPAGMHPQGGPNAHAAVWKHVSCRTIRSYAAECLHELENMYPGLLIGSLGEEALKSTLRDTPESGLNAIEHSEIGSVRGGLNQPPPNFVPPSRASTESMGRRGSVGSNSAGGGLPGWLGRLLQEERTHIADSYARLFVTVVRNYTEDLVAQAMEKAASGDGLVGGDMTATDAYTVMTPSVMPPASVMGGSVLGAGLKDGIPVPGGGRDSMSSLNVAALFQVPQQCTGAPRTQMDVGIPGSTIALNLAKCIPRGRRPARMVTRAVSLVLQSMPNYSTWSKVFIASQLPLFIHVLGLPSRVVFHHFLPLLHGTQVPVVHALLIVATQFPNEIDEPSARALLGRLFMTIQDTTVEPAFRLLALNWFTTLSDRLPSIHHMIFSEKSVRELSPVWHDPLELKELKLSALLYLFERMERLPENLLSVLDSVSEYHYCVRPSGAHAVVFRFLLRVTRLFSSYFQDGLDVPGCLCEMLANRPALLSSVLAVVRYTTSRSVKFVMLRALGRMVKRLEPPGRIRQYIGLLVILTRSGWIGIDCDDVLASLSKLAFWLQLNASDWADGMRILAVCKQIMLHHEDARSYTALQRLLRHMAGFAVCVDLRDAAGRLLQLLMTLSPHMVKSAIVTDTTAFSFERMSEDIVPLLPKQVICPDQSIPFIRFVKSLEERRRSGLFDGHGAVFLPPVMNAGDTRREMSEAEKQLWKAEDEDQKLLDPSVLSSPAASPDSGPSNGPTPALTAPSGSNGLTDASRYINIIESQHCSLRLPFVLQYVRQNGASLPFPPCEMYSLEISFSASEHYEQLRPLRIPYLKRPANPSEQQLQTPIRGMSVANSGETFSAAKSEEAGKGDHQFPHLYKLLLKISPLEPVPAQVKVFLSFSDVRGNTYFGTLGSFHVSFQDMFLPVRLPQNLWATLFQQLWSADMNFPIERWRPTNVCRSVQVLHLGHEEVKKMLHDNLGLFVVPTAVPLAPELFDFDQEEYLRNQTLGQKVELETICVAIFVPPKYHLLLRCTSSKTVSVLRVVTDRSRLLSYLDKFFQSWLPASAFATSTDPHAGSTTGIAPADIER